MKKSRGRLLLKATAAIGLSLCLDTSLMLSSQIMPVIPAAAEETRETDVPQTDHPDSLPDEQTDLQSTADSPDPDEAETSDHSSQNSSVSAEDGSSCGSVQNPAEEPDTEDSGEAAPEESSQEPSEGSSDHSSDGSSEDPSDRPAAPGQEDSSAQNNDPLLPDPSQSDSGALQAETDAFTLSLTPDDMDTWNQAVKDHPGLHLVLIPSQKGSLDPDDGHEPLLCQDYRISFEDENGPVDLSNLTFTAVIHFKTSELERLYPKETSSEAETDPMGVRMKAFSRRIEQPVMETAEIASGIPAPLQFPVNGDDDISLLLEIPNPSFTVQYYVEYHYLTKSKNQSSSGSNIEIIDSSKYGYGSSEDNNGKGGVLPDNSTRPKVFYIDLQSSGSGNSATSAFKMSTYMDPFFEEETYTYFKAPNPHYFNKLLLNGNYSLKSIWILKDGKDPASQNPSDWTAYPPDTRFTNSDKYKARHSEVVLITDGMTMRMVYNETSGTQDINAGFYDYDISSRKDSSGRFITSTGGTSANSYGQASWGTGYGINSPQNYSSPNAHNGKLAFGNVNTGTHLGKVRWTDSNGIVNNLNSYNRMAPNSYKGCTFGLTSGMKGDSIQFAKGVTAPKLFGSDSAVGKHSYEDSRLHFNRVGDTYVLSSASVNNNGKLTTTASGLENFSHPGNYTNIWTNNFWPMDQTPGVDGLSGGSTPVYWDGFKWSSSSATSFTGSQGSNTFPPSDDGQAHNPLFGMQYEVDFKLNPDYTGPLNYFFFGDDDMWVFLDGKPIVDIGGVHSSAGQYVNLWDYIPHGDNKDHKLNFFYTERGLSGSTCYMQFTLPSVSTAIPSLNTGNLKISKQTDSTITSPDYEYQFRIRLRDAQGNELPDEYAYTKYDAQGNAILNSIILRDSQTFTLKSGEYILVDYLPDGAVYTVEETGPGSATCVETSSGQVFYPQANPDTTPVITGSITKDTTISCYFENSEPKNTIDVAKSLTGSDSGSTLPIVGADDLQFYFRFLKEDGTLLFPAGTQYTLHFAGANQTETETLGEDGLITLRRGQTATFENSYLATNVRYYVQELFADGDHDAYSSVHVDNTAATEAGKVTIGTVEYDAWNSAIKDTASDADSPEHTTFNWNNVLDQSKYGSLTIEKALPEGVSLDTVFTFNVLFNNKPVPDGAHCSIDGQSYTFHNSQITLKAGQKALISNLLAGTTYTVTEVPTDGFTAQITNGTGTIPLDQDITVTALNTPDGIEVPITKTDSTGKQILGPAVFSLYSSMPGDGTSAKETKEFNGETWYFEQEITVSGTGTLPGLVPGARYVLEETKSPSGYALLDGPIYLSVGLDRYVTLEEGSDANAALTEDGLGLMVADEAIPPLPSTGFDGTEFIVLAGAILLAGSAAIVWRKRALK